MSYPLVCVFVCARGVCAVLISAHWCLVVVVCAVSKQSPTNTHTHTRARRVAAYMRGRGLVFLLMGYETQTAYFPRLSLLCCRVLLITGPGKRERPYPLAPVMPLLLSSEIPTTKNPHKHNWPNFQKIRTHYCTRTKVHCEYLLCKFHN